MLLPQVWLLLWISSNHGYGFVIQYYPGFIAIAFYNLNSYSRSEPTFEFSKYYFMS